jgi:aminopeptidase-like protein
MATLRELSDDTEVADVGRRAYELCAELYPICRSITGDGVRDTLARVGAEVPLDVHEVPSGTPVLDWVVPPEWNIRDAWIADAEGTRVVDFRESNLHVVSYSEPVRQHLTLEQLRPHLHSLPDRPGLVPYRTSYYSRDWGFCLRDDVLETLPDATYEVVIDSTLEPGALTYGECVLEGDTSDEVLVTAHDCHPSLCNDNLSGITLLAALGKALAAVSHRFTYRLLFIPGTIGSISWLARNAEAVSRIRHGLVLSGIGDRGPMTWKRSRRGDAAIDRVVEFVLEERGLEHRVLDFDPYGYDERQFCSPGYNLPVGRLGRSVHGEYPEYHTSGDDLHFVTPETLAESYRVLLRTVEVLEHDIRCNSLSPMGEPQLGKRGLYRSTGGNVGHQSVEIAYLWVLNLSDGDHSMLDIAERSGLPFDTVVGATDALREAGLLEVVG